MVETHISWVVLTGDYAYKIKKPVDLGFLDYSTPEKRRFYCEEELRLNGRLSPDLYLEVVAITGSADSPAIAGEGPVVDWAVKMRQFPQEALLDRRLEAGLVDGPSIDRVADAVAAFHGAIPAVAADSALGTPSQVLAPALENFRHLRETAPADLAGALQGLEDWTRRTHGALEPVFRTRREAGRIRECHGDMHLGNMAEIDGRLRIFDGIEFNEALRWIDVMSEAAFAMSDLNHRHRPDLGWRFLNRYLEGTGDYAGLVVLGFYRVYRLMVRAKVTAIRLGQREAGSTEWERDRREVDAYVAQARRVTTPAAPALILTRGISGSGKSWLSAVLVEHLEAVRLRSDVERKRLFGLSRDADSRSVPGGCGVWPGRCSTPASRPSWTPPSSTPRTAGPSGSWPGRRAVRSSSSTSGWTPPRRAGGWPRGSAGVTTPRRRALRCWSASSRVTAGCRRTSRATPSPSTGPRRRPRTSSPLGSRGASPAPEGTFRPQAGSYRSGPGPPHQSRKRLNCLSPVRACTGPESGGSTSRRSLDEGRRPESGDSA